MFPKFIPPSITTINKEPPSASNFSASDLEQRSKYKHPWLSLAVAFPAQARLKRNVIIVIIPQENLSQSNCLQHAICIFKEILLWDSLGERSIFAYKWKRKCMMLEVTSISFSQRWAAVLEIKGRALHLAFYWRQKVVGRRVKLGWNNKAREAEACLPPPPSPLLSLNESESQVTLDF